MLLEEILRLIRALVLVSIALLMLVHAAAAQGMEAPVVVEAFARARADQDIDSAMVQFADDAVVRLERSRPRVIAGREDIKRYFDGLNLEPPQILASPRQLADNTITWSERVIELRAGSLEQTGQALVQNGKIVSLTYRPGRLVENQDVAPSLGRPQLSSSMMTGAIGLFGLGLLSLATVRSRRASGSKLRGRMLASLGHWSGKSQTLR